MSRIVLVVAAAALVAGCGSQTTPTSPSATSTHTTGHGPRASTERVVQQVLDRAPLPPGVRDATAAEARGTGPQSVPAEDSHFVTDHRVYVVPLDLEQATSWFEAHQPPGLSSSGTSGASGPGGVTSQGVEFDGRRTRTYDDLEEQVGVYPLDDSRSVVRIDAQADWLLQRTRNEHVPGGASAVTGVRVDHSGARPRHFELTGPAVRQLAWLLNHQRPSDVFGLVNCPNDHGTRDRLHFTGSRPDPVFHVSASGCTFIGVSDDGVEQPALQGGVAVDQLLTTLLAR